MIELVNGAEIEIERGSGKLKDLGITHKCYIFVSGDDKNSVHSKDITAYGLQHPSILTADPKPEEPERTLLVDGENILIDGVEFETMLIGDYSDCIHFKEVGYDDKSRLESEYHKKGYI